MTTLNTHDHPLTNLITLANVTTLNTHDHPHHTLNILTILTTYLLRI